MGLENLPNVNEAEAKAAALAAEQAEKQRAAAEAEAAAKVAAEKQAADAAAASKGTGGNANDPGGNWIPAGGVEKIKQQERESAIATFKADLDKKAQAKGYRDHEAMLDLMAPTKPPKKDDDEADDKKVSAKQALEDERKIRKATEERLDRAKAELAAQTSRSKLERLLMSTGVQDVDYAASLLERETSSMTPEAAEKFDVRAWATKLKASKPYLFGERVVPVDTTGGAGGDAGERKPAGEKPPEKKNDDFPDVLAIDPKTGKYLVDTVTKDRLWNRIVKGAQNAREPVIPKG